MKTFPTFGILPVNTPISPTKRATHCAAMAWKIAYALLWNGAGFTGQQKQDAQFAIRRFFFSAEEKETLYEEFVQRVLLARLHFKSIPFYSFGMPAEWFGDQRPDGFNSTKCWYKKLLVKREETPAMKKEWIIFAHALWQVQNNKSAIVYHQWRSHFATNSQYLLNLFLAVTANKASKNNSSPIKTWLEKQLNIQLPGIKHIHKSSSLYA